MKLLNAHFDEFVVIFGLYLFNAFEADRGWEKPHLQCLHKPKKCPGRGEENTSLVFDWIMNKFISESKVKIFLKYTKFSKLNKAKQVFPTNILCVEGAKMIAVLPEKKEEEWKKEEKTSASKKSLIDGKFFW